MFEALNKVPESQHSADIMRVREQFLAGEGALYRQTILMSSLTAAEMNALVSRACANWAGKVKLRLGHQACTATPYCAHRSARTAHAL